MLGLFVAVFFVYYFAGYVGALIDQEMFPGGSKERVRLYRSLDRFIRESNEHISAVKKSKRKRQKIGQKPIDDLEQAVLSATMVLSKVREQWNNGPSSYADHERLLKDAHSKPDMARRSLSSIVIFAFFVRYAVAHHRFVLCFIVTPILSSSLIKYPQGP